MVLAKVDSYMYKNDTRILPNKIHKDKLRMNERPKCMTRNYKTLRGKQGEHCDINQNKILYDPPLPPLRVMEIKIKVNKWDLIKRFCIANGTISKVKRQLSEWERIIAI